MDIFNEAYQAWLQCDKNSAKAARQLNLPRSTFRDRLDRAKQVFNQEEPVICFWDIETSHLISAHYGTYDVNINLDNILLDWFIICAAWKIKGEKTQTVSLLDDMDRFNNNTFDLRYGLHIDDYHVVKTLHEMLNNVDILVHHNGDRFDIKKFNARAIYHGLTPIHHLKMVDTLKVAKSKFSITSNSLDYLCQYFGLPAKIHNERGLSLRATLCEEKAIKDYVTYNKQDVECLEALYNELLPYMTNHPNMGLYKQMNCCPNCGSHNILQEGYDYTRLNKRNGFRCYDCGAVFTDGKSQGKAIYR